MIALCTDRPSARLENDRVILSIPSGKETLEIALSLNQAMFLWRSTRDSAMLGFDTVASRGGADLLSFCKASE